MKKYCLGVIIGRFQPFHKGHEHLINYAMSQCENVLILVGSANKSRSEYNPFSFQERKAMIKANYPSPQPVTNLDIKPLNDYFYNDSMWTKAVQDTVAKTALSFCPGENKDIALFGFNKDASTYYLSLFPDWEYNNVPLLEAYKDLSATKVRDTLFNKNSEWMHMLPVGILGWMAKFFVSPEFEWLQREADEQRAYRKSWETAPFKPTFTTVDCLVEQMGNILLIERKFHPGAGLMALPGGFIDQDNYLIENAIRELKEETAIEDWRGPIPPGRLKSFVVGQRVFDHPLRSARGRTVTHLFHFRLPEAKNLYKVKGMDDAEKADWHELSSLRSHTMFEDHGDMISTMLGIHF